MTDRYERIRKALAMGPTPGPWYLDGEGIRALVRDANGVIVTVRHRMPGHKNETNMRLIAACDPDTIRALLAERDQLAAALETAREDAERWRALREMDGGEIYALLGDCDGIHPEQTDAAIDRARGKGGAK